MNSPRLAPWLVALVVLLAGWRYLDSRPQPWPPGVIAPDTPRQVDLDPGEDDAAGAPWRRADFTATPRARFGAAVRVLSKEHYRFDPIARAAPVDLAVGWGAMSDTAIIDALEVSQGARFYTWRYEAEPPLPVGEITRHSANWHIVPGNAEVERRLDDLRTGDVVELDGWLVDLRRDDGGMARTSLRRDDSGAGACEIIWVERLAVRYRD